MLAFQKMGLLLITIERVILAVCGQRVVPEDDVLLARHCDQHLWGYRIGAVEFHDGGSDLSFVGPRDSGQ